jgi:DNA-binding NarL/FixJ family response regulator
MSYKRLTMREFALVQGLKQGLDTATLAPHLGLTLAGVRSAYQRLYEHYDADSRHKVLARLCHIQIMPNVVATLRPRDLALLNGLSAGLGNGELAMQLILSPSGITSALARLYQAYGVHARHQLLARVCQIEIQRCYLPIRLFLWR